MNFRENEGRILEDKSGDQIIARVDVKDFNCDRSSQIPVVENMEEKKEAVEGGHAEFRQTI